MGDQAIHIEYVDGNVQIGKTTFPLEELPDVMARLRDIVPMTPDERQFCADVVTTACEGGIDGWARLNEYRWYSPTLEGGSAEPGPDNGPNAWADVLDIEEEQQKCSKCGRTIMDLDEHMRWSYWSDGGPKWGHVAEVEGQIVEVYANGCDEPEPVYFRLTPEVVRRAVLKMVSGPVPGWAEDYRANLALAWMARDAGDVDAWMADAIVQYAMYGEVVYG